MVAAVGVAAVEVEVQVEVEVEVEVHRQGCRYIDVCVCALVYRLFAYLRACLLVN